MIERIKEENSPMEVNILKIDGNIISFDKANLSAGHSENAILNLTVEDPNLSYKISTLKFNALPRWIVEAKLNFNIDTHELVDKIYVHISKGDMPDGKAKLSFKYSWDIIKWKKNYSLRELYEVFDQTIKFNEEYKIMKWENNGIFADLPEYHIECPDIDQNELIKTVVFDYLNIIDKINEQVRISIKVKEQNYTLINIFDFPPEVKVACEQYLIYFVEFLKNIGIEATTDIEHDAGKTLFSVIPANQDTALDQIHEALKIYLQIPVNLANAQAFTTNISINEQQLLAQIQHLNSQLNLSNAIIQSKEQTIQNHNNLIEQQKQVINASILQQCLTTQLIKNEQDDEEKVLGGTISLTKYEGKGFNINIADIYRKVREFLTKK